MTILELDLSETSGPKYRAIAAALSDAIASGELASGARLPTQRDLAWRLGVTIGTVSRAYAEIERRGLLSGEVGRGTFVRPSPPTTDLPLRPAEESDAIDLTLNFPAPGDERQALAESLAALATDPKCGMLLDYQPDVGVAGHRAAGAAWIGRRGWPADPAHIVVTAGAQHGILACLAALTRPGDWILGERLTYQGIKPAAAMLGLRIEGLALDADGIVPEAFERAVNETGARVLYCMPTLHNPTTATMPEARRREIADIAVRHDVTIIEDDIYGVLPDSAPPPLAAYAPDRTCYVTSLSKALAPGLRVGYVAAPPRMVERIGAAVRASCWMAAPLMAEVAARWIFDGVADRILANHRRIGETRRARALTILGDATAPEGSLHLWLHLPEPWRASEFTAAVRDAGVAIAAAETFAIGRGSAPHAVRICLGTPRDTATLETGLQAIARVLDAAEAPRAMIV